MADNAVYVGEDLTTKGSWVGVKGSDGYIIPKQTGVVQSLPGYLISYGASPDGRFTWQDPSSDVRATQYPPVSSNRIACLYYDASQIIISINIGSNTKRVGFYCLDWDNLGRHETLRIFDHTVTTQFGSTIDVSSFSVGKWHTWDITDNIKLIIDNLAGGGLNGGISMIAFDPVPSPPPPPTGIVPLLMHQKNLRI